jgi:hypothetical protein
MSKTATTILCWDRFEHGSKVRNPYFERVKSKRNPRFVKQVILPALLWGFIFSAGMTLWDVYDGKEINWAKSFFFFLAMSLLSGAIDAWRWKKQNKKEV